MKTVLIIASILTFTSSVKLPSNFKKCNRKDVNFQQCVIEAAQDGLAQLSKPIKEVNLPNLEPFELKEATIGNGTGPVSLNQKFKNCHIYGFRVGKFEKLTFDFDSKNVDFVIFFPEIRKLCDYEIKGQVLVVPVNGEGNSTIVLKNLKVPGHFKYEEIKKKNGLHMKFTSGVLSLEPELVTYDFCNQKDKRLSDNINPVLNENWKVVFDDVKDGYSELVKQIVLNSLNGFFAKVSIAEAFD